MSTAKDEADLEAVTLSIDRNPMLQEEVNFALAAAENQALIDANKNTHVRTSAHHENKNFVSKLQEYEELFKDRLAFLF